MKEALTLGAIMVSMAGMFIGLIAILDSNLDTIYEMVNYSNRKYDDRIQELELRVTVINERCECTREVSWVRQEAGTLQRER